MRVSFVWPVTLLVAAILAVNSAEAAKISSEADAYFHRGVECYQSGDYDCASEEFSLAHKSSTDFRYLYNVGQSFAARWRPVEALEVFDRYLREGANRISVQRRDDVQQAIAQQRERIGWFQIRVSPVGATIRVDGRDVGRSPLTAALPMAVGEHVVSAFFEGRQPMHQTVTLTRRETKQVVLTLAPIPHLLPFPSRKGQLAIGCALPEVRVYVDAHPVAKTPLGSHLLVEEGLRTVRLERVGYVPQEAIVAVSESVLAQVKCDMPPMKPSNPMASGRVNLGGTDAEMVVLVDGRPSPAQILVPAGLHIVEVHRDGHVPWRQSIRVAPAAVHQLWVSLQPTPARLREVRSRAKARRNWTYGLGATGVASLGAALGVGLWNHARYNDWKGMRDELRADQELDDSVWDDRRNKASELLRSVHAADMVTVGLAVAGGAMLVGAAIVSLGGGDSGHNLESERTPPAAASGTRSVFAQGSYWKQTTTRLRK